MHQIENKNGKNTKLYSIFSMIKNKHTETNYTEKNMGFEFRITASLTPGQRQHLEQLLAARPQAPSNMPDTDVRLTNAGLYVCQSLRPEAWHGLDALRSYLDAQGVPHAVEEIDD